MKERRRFYRVDDSVILNYRLFPMHQLDKAVARLKVLNSQHKNLHDSLQAVESRLELLLDEISEPLPEIAEALKLINRKLSVGLLGNRMDAGTYDNTDREGDTFSTTQEINLSASGLAFHSPISFSHGETMEIEFVLFPEYCNIKAIGKVVACREKEDELHEGMFRVAIDFIYVREEDRESIISHVLLKQGKDLKKQRQTKEELQSNLECVV